MTVAGACCYTDGIVRAGGPEEHFNAALDSLVERVKQDRSVLAAVLCVSLSHDTVWAKSDIDLILITIDEKKVSDEAVSLYADGVNVHASLMTRAEFRKTAEGAIRNSFMHSLLAKGRLLYTHDETIAAMCAQLQTIGGRDTRLQLLSAGTAALYCTAKANKWFLTRGDLDYTALWILYAATPLAKIEFLMARRLVDREVLPQALKINPAFFQVVYSDLLNTKKTPKNVKAALSAIDGYLEERTAALFGAVIEHLREVGEARSATEIEHYFERNFGIRGVTGACEYLSDRGLIGKAQLPVRLTKRSNVAMDELAFFYGTRTADAGV